MAFCTAACAAAIPAVDDRGKEIVLAAPAQRVVALAPSFTELIYAAGAGERLVGAASYSDYPPAAARVARIGDAARIDFERVLSLAPDLIVGWKSGNRVADIERLESLGFKVLVFEPARLADIERILRVLGAVTGFSAPAETAARAFAAQAAALRARYENRRSLRVFYEIWHRPLMTVNGAHMISEIVRVCGGNNIFSAAPFLTPAVSLEELIVRQPEVIVGGHSGQSAVDFRAAWAGYGDFARLRDITAIYIDPDLVQRQTPRVLAGARELCERLDALRAGMPAN
jgi:iron complex transport system substrate-binding protein